MTSQIIYLEVITVPNMLPICSHLEPHDACSGGTIKCLFPSCDVTRWNVTTGEEKTDGCKSHSLILTCYRLSSRHTFMQQLKKKKGGWTKLGARAAHRSLMPSSCLPSVCTRVLIGALLYLYHHQAFGALHQHTLFTLTCTAEEKWLRVSSYFACDIWLRFYCSLSSQCFIPKHSGGKIQSFSIEEKKTL